ncbi:MAG: hypothetical protein ABFC56_00110 [Clostridiaceae bacterium]
MHIEINRLSYLQSFLEDIIASINPITGESFPTVVSSAIILLNPCFEEISEILETLSLNPILYKKSISSRRKPFYLYKNEVECIEISREPISISKLAFRINELIDQGTMSKLKATQLTAGLVSMGFLEMTTNTEGDQAYKIATKKGSELGISTVLKTNSNGETYSLNLYNEKAQRYIANNILNIIF